MAVNPVFDLAEEAFKDYSIENLHHYRILENQNGNQLNSRDIDTVKTLRFRVDDMNNWMNIGRSYVRLEGALRPRNPNGLYGDNALSGAKSLSNNSASLFRRCTLKANGITIENSQDHKMIDVTINDLMSNDSEYGRSYGSVHNYHPGNTDPSESILNGGEIVAAADTVATVAVAAGAFSSALVIAGGHSNPDGAETTLDGKNADKSHQANGLKTYYARGETKIFEVLIPLNKIFHFLKAHDKVVRGIQWEIELEFEPHEKIVKYTPSSAGNHNISPYFYFGARGAELYLERVLPRIEVRNVLNNLLLNGFKKSINYEDYVVRQQRIASNIDNYDWRIATTVSRPTKLYVCAKWANRDSATFFNSQTFDYASMTRVFVRVNGVKYPDEDYQITKRDNVSPAHGHHQVIMDIMKMKGLDVSEHTDMLNRGCLINARNWETHYPIYAFDLTKYPGDALFSGSSEILVHIERDADIGPSFCGKDANGFPSGALAPATQLDLYAVLGYEKVVELSMNQNESSIVIR